MPGGLPEITQKVGGDTGAYVEAYRRARAETRGLIDDNKELRRTIAEVSGVMRGLGGAEEVGRVNAAIREQQRILGDHSRAISDVSQAGRQFGSVQGEITDMVREAGLAARETTGSLSGLATGYGKARDAGNDARDSARSYRTEVTQLEEAIRKAGDAADRSGTAGVRTFLTGMEQARRAAADTSALVNMAAAAGGAAGGIFGGGGGGGGGGFGMGDAARHWAVVSGALGTWLPRIHYAMMAFNELASTVGPALVAAGAAGAVGYQGGQLAVTRYQALNTVQEALGKSLGQTSAGYVGLKSNLQAAQNAANTGVWELAGAAINSLTGKTAGFTQMGTNTIAMLDTFAAKATLAFKGGAGNEIQALTQQGTHYLQQFGQIAGNIGTTFLHVAPNLPGIGGDLISTLQGATKAASWLTGAVPGGILGTVLAGEAGARYGPTIVGGAAAGLGRIGLGTVAHTATAAEIAAAAGRGEIINAGEMVAGTGAAGALGSATIPVLATAAAAAYLIGKTATAQSAQQQHLGLLQGNIAQSIVGGGGINSIISAMGQVGPTGGPQQMGYGASVGKAYSDVASPRFFKGLQEVFQTGWGSLAGIFQGPGTKAGDLPTSAALNQQALSKMATSFNQVLGAGQQVAKMMGVGLPDAFGLTQQALLQVGNAFDKHGNLTAAAKQQIANLQSGYAAMNSTSGVFGKNVAAVNTQLGLQNTQVASVNSAWDQFTNNAVQGAVGASGLAQNLQLAAPSLKQTAQALSGFGPSSAAAWATFASPSASAPGLLQQAQSQADWVRIAQTSGALTGPQGAGMTAYLAKQLLPYGAKSPLAASAIGILGQQAGMPSGLDQKQQTAWLDKHTMSQQQYNKALMQAGVTMSSVSGQAAHFGQTMQSNVVGAMASGAVNLPKMSADMAKFAGSLSSSGGFGAGALKTVAADLKAVGVNAASAQAIISNVLSAHGITGAAAKKIMLAVGADTAAAQAKINGVHGKSVSIAAQAAGIAAVQAAINAVHGKNVTISVTTIYRQIGALTGSPGGVPYTAAGAVAQSAGLYTRLLGHAAGFRVPGFGGGDRHLAFLEGGEAVVPKHLTAAVAPFLAAHGVPGFASGMIPSAMMNIGQMQAMMSQMPGGGLPIPAIAQQVLDTLLGVLSRAGAWKQAGVNIINGITYSLSGTGKDAAKVGHQLVSETSKAATALAGKIATEMNYARSTAASTVAGVNFAGMNVTPGTGGGTVMEQMQSYLGSVKSFTGDLKTLGREHLSKAIISQLVAAGPVQGDALAQSILGDYGGVKGVNAVYNQIGQASKGLGAQAAMDRYGGFVAPNLRSGTFSQNTINISVNVPGGATGNLPLTPAQIKTLTEEIQAKLLQQARRNNKTGMQARGKGA